MKFANSFIAFLTFVFFLMTAAVSADDSYWIGALACPFTTVTDEISEELFYDLLAGNGTEDEEIHHIYISTDALEKLSTLTKDSHMDVVRDEKADRFIRENRTGTYCVVLPLTSMDPTMKYVRVGDHPSPWSNEYSPEEDILAVKTDEGGMDTDELTTVLITGTTALVRTTSYKMYLNGPLYPTEDIIDVFRDSDITHISNESSIWSQCPEPLNTFGMMQFCSNPRSYELLDHLKVDVIELTGNHLRDYDWPPLKEMLDEFEDRGYRFYGAGRSFEEAAKPVIIEENSHRFIFLGCNIAGPDHVFVEESHPGVNKCDFDQLADEIRQYKNEGMLPIVTVQYYETYSHVPTEMQISDFTKLHDAGAVIVSGSQAHYPQIFQPYKDSFIHYGPGNLFFDQMDTPVEGTSHEFLDRYVFYRGRLLQLEVITAQLTDFCKPVPMEGAEREKFLTEMFGYMR